jgi:hypothetical protein
MTDEERRKEIEQEKSARQAAQAKEAEKDQLAAASAAITAVSNDKRRPMHISPKPFAHTFRLIGFVTNRQRELKRKKLDGSRNNVLLRKKPPKNFGRKHGTGMRSKHDSHQNPQQQRQNL